MTVSSLSNRTVFAGTGGTGPFTCAFGALSAADLLVIRSVAGVETTLALGTDYTVSGVGSSFVSVTLTLPLAVGTTLFVIRVPQALQLQDYTDGDRFPAESVEAQFDRLTMLAQRLLELAAQTLRVGETDATVGRLPPAATRASKFLAFDASGEPIAAAGTSANLGPVSAFIATLLDDVDAAAARSTLGVYSTAQTDAAIVAALAALSSSIPAGFIWPYAGATLPTGWLLCHGQEVLRATYTALDAAIGTTWGAYTNGSGGAGTTHMRLPDLRGRGLFGRDDMGGSPANRITTGGSGVNGALLGTGGGAQSVPHTHEYSGTTSGSSSNQGTLTGGASNAPNSVHTHTYSGTTGGASDALNLPPMAIVNWAIKT